MEYQKDILENVNYLFNEVKNNDITELSKLLISFKEQNIFFIGIGKSNNVCLHFSDLLNCINFNSRVLNSANLLHGNMGCIKSTDLIVCTSKSGNTVELLNIINIIKIKINPQIILLSSRIGNISEFVDKTITVPIKNESILSFNLIPTNSIVIFIIFINIVIGKIIELSKINKIEYINNHISGDIGTQFKMVKDCLIKNDICSMLEPQHTIKDVIVDMNKHQIGISVIKNNDEIQGIVTNRDICLFLENKNDLNIKVSEIMRKDFHFLNDENTYIKDINIKRSYLPVIKEGILLGIVQLN